MFATRSLSASSRMRATASRCPMIAGGRHRIPRSEYRAGEADRSNKDARTVACVSALGPAGRLRISRKADENRRNADFGEVFPPARARSRASGDAKRGGGVEVTVGMWLMGAGLGCRQRSAFCAARIVASMVSVNAAKQPGRERPPAPARDRGPALGTRRVAHAPVACRICPDNMGFRACRRSDTVPRQNWPQARRAPRLETVTAVTLPFVKETAPCQSSSRARAASNL